jgi:sarcosine oxidase / L-pipecolate oxidase
MHTRSVYSSECSLESHTLTTRQFLPVIGSLVADALQGVMDPAIAKKFAVDREVVTVEKYPPCGFTVIRELKEEKLCTPQNFLPSA